MKNLPVLLIKGIILLPNNELRIEFDNDGSKTIIDVAEYFHEGKLLIVSQENVLEEKINIKQLPKIGVVAKIVHKIELPNGKIRVLINGIKRSKVIEYLNLDKPGEVLESIVEYIPEKVIEDEPLLINKLYKEIEELVRLNSYYSNSILALIKNVTSLSKMTDIIAPFVQNEYRKLNEYKYLETIDPKVRFEMLLEEIYNQKELYRIEKKIDSKIKRNLDETQKEYLLKEKIKTIKEELGEIDTKEDEIDKLNKKVFNGKYPIKIKERLKKELKRYESIPQTSPEINVSRNYIEWLMDLPWTKYTKDNNNLNEVKKSLDKTHYGLDKIKERLIEYLAVKLMSKDVKSPILCLVGPPGVGKTSFAFSIAEALNRKFVKISVAGVNDEAELIGHRKTYIGANPGRIIQSLKKAKSKNPVFLIDEIDKMTKDYKGDPASILLEILDPEQNHLFSDNYIEEEFDLSKILFITTANYINDIPEALLDRLEIIKLNSYTEFEKLDIVKDHLLEKVLKNHGLSHDKVVIKDEIILYIIRHYTKEAGVRELERQLSQIIRKIVTKLVINNIKMSKIEVKLDELKLYLGKEKYFYQNTDKNNKIGVVNGLAYTPYGGDILPIEVSYYEGKGDLILTGSLGKVMKESAQIALSYIKAHYQYFNINLKELENKNIHIHVPEGAIPKEGPSAGIALTTALVSSFSKLKISSNIAMTGEITLNGEVLPIGGLKEKIIGAYRSGVKKIIFPKDNLKDLDEIPKDLKNRMEFISVKNYKEVLEELKR